MALVILALTAGLIRSESAGDLRAMPASGATPGIRRTLTATAAGALALLGALLGVAGAYAVLAAPHSGDLGDLSDVPVLYLGLAGIGVPLAAAGVGWLVAGREPPAMAGPSSTDPPCIHRARTPGRSPHGSPATPRSRSPSLRRRRH